MKYRAKKKSRAKILREYGPFPGVDHVAGVTYDGEHVWFASGDKLNALNPKTGKKVRTIDVAAHAGSGLAWAEGTLWVGQYRNRKIHQIDPETGAVLRTVEANRFVTGVTWVDGDF